MCHLMPRCHLPEWREDERAFVHYDSSGLNHAITSNRVCHKAFQSVVCHFIVTSCKYSWQWLAECCLDFNLISKCPFILLSSLRQMPLWHQVAYATAIHSGIISLCTQKILRFDPSRIFIIMLMIKILLGSKYQELWLYSNSFEKERKLIV